MSLRKKALFLAIACMPLSVVLADGDGECVEMASFAQSAAEREKECEVESQVELSAFAGWRGRQFTDLARA